DAPEGDCMTAIPGVLPAERSVSVGNMRSRSIYLVSAVCLLVVAMMLFPLVVSFFASVKTPEEAVAVPPTYLPQSLSLANYMKVFGYQAGLPTYLFNSLLVAFLTILFCLALSVPAGYGLARFRVPGKEVIFLFLLASLMIPYQALLTPLYMMFAPLGLTNSHVGLAIVHTIFQLPFS